MKQFIAKRKLRLAVCALFIVSAVTVSANDSINPATELTGAYEMSTLVAQNDQPAESASTPAAAAPTPENIAEGKINAGRTAWMLVSCLLVLLMIPGLALFYGGMVRSKNILNTFMLSMALMAVIGIEWVAFGYKMAFGPDILIGSKEASFLGWGSGWFMSDINWLGVDSKGVPEIMFYMFQGMFAIITPALISGAIAERVKFSSYLVFSLLWAIVVYNPLAHMVWQGTGYLFNDGVLDFAGGTVVHISAGFSSLILAIFFLGKRTGYPEDTISPSSLTYTLLGAGLLWVGWFGFNAGSASAFDDMMITAGLAFGTTQIAAAAAALAWILLERIMYGKMTAVGLASGIVAGLVGITPAAGHVTFPSAFVLGIIAGAVCFFAVAAKGKLGYDDSLDCFGVHGIGGLVGALLVGIIGSLNGVGEGQFGKQFYGAIIGIGYAVVGTFIVAFIVDKTMGLRVDKKSETLGLDQTQHGEQGFRLH